jgi:hypothetical protein
LKDEESGRRRIDPNEGVQRKLYIPLHSAVKASFNLFNAPANLLHIVRRRRMTLKTWNNDSKG